VHETSDPYGSLAVSTGNERVHAHAPRDVVDEVLSEVIELCAGSVLALDAALTKLSAPPCERGDAAEAIDSAISMVRSALDELQQQVPGGSPEQMALGFVTRQRRTPS
jgi:hypothetical protein